MTQGKVLVIPAGEDPPHVPTSKTRRIVERMAACGLDDKEIAYCTGVPIHEIRATYKEEIENGLAVTTARMGAALIRSGLNGDVNAQRFFLQSRARWVVPTKVEHTGEGGGPVQVEVKRKLVDSILAMARSRPPEEAVAPAAPAPPPGPVSRAAH